jgi:hypothetical protein
LNSDGHISIEEMVASTFFDMADFDKSNSLDREEFLHLMHHMETHIKWVSPKGSWEEESVPTFPHPL